MSLRVLAAGTHSLIVDRGRAHSRGLGIPVGGPADRASLMIGNALAGNPPFTPALEIALTGPTLLADSDVGVCVVGAPFMSFREGEEVHSASFTLRAGQTLRIGGTPSGCRAYVCVPGGFRAREVLESVTGFEPVKEGDVLECEESSLPGRGLANTFPSPPASGGEGLGVREDAAHSDKEKATRVGKLEPPRPQSGGRGEHNTATAIRCLPGPQADWFDDAFFRHSYRVTPASSRMGIRLDGPPLTLPNRELVSEPVAPGAIQITNEGKPIVLGVDGQTIGGYPKIAHVISADLDVLGQLRPGEEVRFQLVTEKAAEAAARDQREMLSKWLRRIRIAISG